MPGWLDAVIDWKNNITSRIPSMDDVSTYGHLSGIPGGELTANAIDAASQIARPIGAIAGAIGNINSEAGMEEAERGVNWSPENDTKPNPNLPSIYDAAKEGSAGAPKLARQAVNLLDVAGVATGGIAGAVGKAAPAVAKALSIADLGLSGLDTTLGAGDIAEGVRDKDAAKIGMGLFRVGMNAYSGSNAVRDLKSYGIKDTAAQAAAHEVFDAPPSWKPNKFGDPNRPLSVDPDTGYVPDKQPMLVTRKQEKSPGGRNYTHESRSVASDKDIARMSKNPEAVRAYGEMADYIDAVSKIGADELVGPIAGAREAAGIPGQAGQVYGATKNFRGYTHGGTEYGHTYTTDGFKETSASANNAFYINAHNIASEVKRDMSWWLDGGEIDPAIERRAEQYFSPEMKQYVESVRAGGPRTPEIEQQLAADMFIRKVTYTSLHEPVGHTISDTIHVPGHSEYRAPSFNKEGKGVESIIPVNLNDAEVYSGFEPAHNTIMEAMADPGRLVDIKSRMTSDSMKEASRRWYSTALGDGAMLKENVARRNDRVIGRAEGKAATQEVMDEPTVPKGDLQPDSLGSLKNLGTLLDEAEVRAKAGEQPPTPPGSVPPGSEAGSVGPQMNSLGQRIRTALAEQQKANNRNDLKKPGLRNVQAQALKANEEKFASQMISLEDFNAENKKILSGAMDIENTVNAMPISEAEKYDLKRMIAQQNNDDVFLRNRVQLAFDQMVKGERLQPEQLAEVRNAMRDSRIRIEADPATNKIKDFVYNMAGFPRAIMTAWDLSAGGRQGMFASVINPKIAKDAFVDQLKALRMTESEFGTYMQKLKDPQYNPYAQLSQAAGLHFSESMRKGAPDKMEEAFMHGKWAEKIPGVRRSEQAYIAYLNKLRVELFNKHARIIEASGEPLLDELDGVSQKMKDLAYMVNTLTGRGELSAMHMSPNSPIGKKLGLTETFAPGKDTMNKMHEGLTSVFFAPRFQASRAALMRDTIQAMVGGGLDPAISKIYMKNVIGTIIVISSTMAALQQMSVGTFQPNPLKKDFGVLKVGNTRYDAFAGLKPWAKIVSQLSTDHYYSGRSRVAKKYGEYGGQSKTGLIGKFGQQKLSPVTGMVIEAMTGEDFMGRKSQLWRNVYQHTTPMIVQTISDLIAEDDAEQLPYAVPAALVGIGVNTYSDKKFKRERR